MGLGSGLKRLGQAFVTLALVGAVALTLYALLASRPAWQAVGMCYGAAMALGIAGAILISWSVGASVRQEAESEVEAEAGVDAGAVEEQLTRVVSKLQEMNTNSETIDIQDIGRMIDAELGDDITCAFRACSILSRSSNHDRFSDLMVRFDAGQRLLDQARTASAEGRAEDVWDSLSIAEERLAEACVVLKRLRQENEHPSHN